MSVAGLARFTANDSPWLERRREIWSAAKRPFSIRLNLSGFEFVELCCPEARMLSRVITPVSRNRSCSLPAGSAIDVTSASLARVSQLITNNPGEETAAIAI